MTKSTTRTIKFLAVILIAVAGAVAGLLWLPGSLRWACLALAIGVIAIATIIFVSALLKEAEARKKRLQRLKKEEEEEESIPVPESSLSSRDDGNLQTALQSAKKKAAEATEAAEKAAAVVASNMRVKRKAEQDVIEAQNALKEEEEYLLELKKLMEKYGKV